MEILNMTLILCIQFLLDTIEVFCNKYDCDEIVKEEYKKRIKKPTTDLAYRYTPVQDLSLFDFSD